jgi:3-deoxy-D-manno-octulosonic-acid transferase
MSRLYRFLTGLGAPLIALYLRLRRRKGREDATRFAERMGIASLPRPQGKIVWCHAASVGEAMSVLALVKKLRERFPDWHILLTTGTVTSAKLIASRLPLGVFHQYVPVDRWPYVSRFLDHWRPDLALWVESELWPNMLAALKVRRIKAVLLNGRMSEKSYKRWRLINSATKNLLSTFSLGLAQTGAERNRFAALGLKDVRVIGNLKYTSEPLDHDPQALDELRQQIGTRPVWLVASTHPGEEEIALAVHRYLRKTMPNILTLIAPRHPNRGDAITSLIEKEGLTLARRSKGEACTAATQIYLADTMGEMGLFYRLASLCCLAGSFTWGGHNPVEPAMLGCAMVFGPKMDNFLFMADDILASGAALQVMDESELAEVVLRLFQSTDERETLANAARSWTASKQSILNDTLDVLAPFFEAPSIEAPR